LGERIRSTDLIKDYICRGDDFDNIDLRLLNLNTGGIARADWINDHISQAANGDVTVDIGNLTVRLIDHDDLGEGFLAQVGDGIFL